MHATFLSQPILIYIVGLSLFGGQCILHQSVYYQTRLNINMLENANLQCNIRNSHQHVS